MGKKEIALPGPTEPEQNLRSPAKFFRFYLSYPKPASPVVRCVADYTVEERARLWESFRPVAEHARRRHRLKVWINVILLAALLGMLFISADVSMWIFFAWIAFNVAWDFLARPALICPGCQNDLEQGFGRYCPECGSEQLRPRGLLRWPRCSSCGKSLRVRKNRRRYKIRACTHCGIALDEKGL